jgi:MYXO-CTERM domain-containing protein
MKKFLAASALAGAAVLAVAPTGAGAQESATVSLMHGIPGATVDVVVDGSVVIPGFEPGSMQDLSSFAGQTLANVEVRAAGTEDVVIGPIESLPVPDAGNWTVVAHLGADGTPTLTPFENDVSPLAAGQGRLTVRHTAAAPAVDIILADGSRPFTNLSNPNEAAADLPAGTVSAEVVPTGADEPVVIGPADLPVAEGSSLIVYAVGSLDGGTIQTLTETIDGLGSAPGAVQTGNSPVDDGTPGSLPWIVAAAAALAAGGALTLRRRSATVPVRDR